MTGDHTAWWIPGDYDTQEFNYTQSRLSQVRELHNNPHLTGGWPWKSFSETGLQTALQMKTDDGLYINIHEAAVLDFPTMNLDLQVENGKRKVENNATQDSVSPLSTFHFPLFTLKVHLTPDADCSRPAIPLGAPSRCARRPPTCCVRASFSTSTSPAPWRMSAGYTR